MRWKPALIALGLVVVVAIVSIVLVLDGDSADDEPRYVDDLSGIRPGEHVQLHDRTYDLSDTFTVPTGARVDGNGASLRHDGGKQSAVTMSTEAALSDVSIAANGGLRSVVLVPEGTRAATLDSVDVTGTGKQQSGVLLAEDSAGVEITGGRILKVRNGIQINGGHEDVRVSGVSIDDWTNRGIRVQGRPGETSKGLTIAAVAIGPNVGSGASRQQITVRSTGRARHQDIHISDTDVEGRGTSFENKEIPGTGDQISVVNADGVVIEGCRSLAGGERGINVNDSTDVEVKGNTVKDSDAVGIGIGSLAKGKAVRDVEVEANEVTNSGRATMEDTTDYSLSGIRLTHVVDGTVRGNTVLKTVEENKPHYAIVVDSVRKVTVEDNTTQGSFRRDILDADDNVRTRVRGAS